ncbi:MAG: DUF4838 domain-containing protein [Planctomycetota bacterium]|jgi:hypothetical protein
MALPLLLFVGLVFPRICAGTEDRAPKKDPFPPAKAPLLTLVEDGEARAVVVAPPLPSAIEARAIDELVGYVRKMTGVELEVRAEGEGNRLPLYVGSAAKRGLKGVEWSRLGADGFVLKSGPGGVYIAGNRELGTLYGVYHLLEKHLGVRWFMPGEIGEVVPRRDTLVVGTFEETEIPAFRIRWIESGDWALRQKMNVDVEVGGRPAGVNWRWSFHTHFKLIPPEDYYDDHPEWFALIGRKRPRPAPGRQSQQLCTSNEELIEEMARRVIETFDGEPSLDILALAPQDGGGFCQCEACVALDEQRRPEEAWHARYSRRLALFNNDVARRVAREHPDKILKVGAYAMYLRVPQDPGYRPEPNLAVQVCHTYSCNSHPIASEDCRGNTNYFRRELEHWAKISPHLFIYEYYNKGAWGGLFYHQVHLIRHDLPYYHRLGAEAFYTQPAGARWPVCGLNHYVAAKLAWDIDLDVDRILEDFYEKFYAEAADPMRRFWQTVEGAFAGYEECLSPFGRNWTTLVAPDIFTPQVLAALEDAVRQAEKDARSEIVQRRVQLTRVRLDFTKRAIDYLAAVRSPFGGIDLKDPNAVAGAHRKAIELGEPLSAELKRFCRKHDLAAYPRLIDVHHTLRFIVDLPDREPILK